MTKPIEDYALIGDGQSAALVSRDGSMDWLCLPRFDSDACFAALLGDERNGCWRIAPAAADFEAKRRYCTDTLVLETEFTTSAGRAMVLDFMPIRTAQHSAIIRIIIGLEGEVAMRSTAALRFDYGITPPWYTRKSGGIIGKVGPDLVVLRADVPLELKKDIVSAQFTVKTGEQLAFTLQHDGSTTPEPPPLDAQRLLAETKAWWLDWIAQFKQPVEWPAFIKRSLIVLKALTYLPTGGMVAAPTLGLPERPGGRMNWDYRYCWLRDSTFTLTAFLNAGFKAEAHEWLHWLLRAVAGNPERLRIAYRVDGGRRLLEWNVDWLPGYGGAKPVRVGNAAADQRQLDVVGEIIDSLHLAARAGLERSDWEEEVERRLIQKVSENWRKPDQGLWESRGHAKHFVYSKVMAWVAVDRFLKMDASQACSPERRAELERLHAAMHAQICARGYSAERGCFVAYYGTRRIDASLLLLPLVGFLPIGDPRIAATIAAVEAELMEGGLVRRYKARRFVREEGCFIACSCWLAECMIMQGRREEARALLERVMSLANDVGLLAEEYHVPSRRLLGNYPQALSHLAVINTALSLSNPVLQRGGG